MTPKERAAMQQAFDALENAYENGFLTGITGLKTIDIITALREALRPEVAPDGRVAKTVFTLDDMTKAFEEGRKNGRTEALAEQAEQEPMYISESCAERGCACHYSVEVDGEPVAVYSAPVRTKDLTDDEVDLIDAANWEKDNKVWGIRKFARAVIAAYKEKNK